MNREQIQAAFNCVQFGAVKKRKRAIKRNSKGKICRYCKIESRRRKSDEMYIDE